MFLDHVHSHKRVPPAMTAKPTAADDTTPPTPEDALEYSFPSARLEPRERRAIPILYQPLFDHEFGMICSQSSFLGVPSASKTSPQNLYPSRFVGNGKASGYPQQLSCCIEWLKKCVQITRPRKSWSSEYAKGRFSFCNQSLKQVSMFGIVPPLAPHNPPLIPLQWAGWSRTECRIFPEAIH